MTNKSQTITNSEAMSEIRKEAAKNGMTFKRQNTTINGAQSYMFINRATGEKIIENCTFWTSYENCMCGYVEQNKCN